MGANIKALLRRENDLDVEDSSFLMEMFTREIGRTTLSMVQGGSGKTEGLYIVENGWKINTMGKEFNLSLMALNIKDSFLMEFSQGKGYFRRPMDQSTLESSRIIRSTGLEFT